MSDLRKQLDSLKRNYKSARYPGNLADELLAPPRWSRMRIGAFATLATGIAAAILISLLHTPTVTTPAPPGKPTMIASTQEVHEGVMPMSELASVPTLPEDVSIVPTHESFVPSAESLDFGSMPALPSVSFEFGSLSTTEEPV